MRYLISLLLAIILFAGCSKEAEAGLVSLPSGDLISGPLSVTNVNGTGLNLDFSFSGDITTDGMITYAGADIGGNGSTRFGWEGTVNSGFFHTPTTAFRIDATNGTFDGNIGFEKNVGSSSDFLWIESDGVFTPGTSWTTVGNRIEFNPSGIFGFVSGDPGGGFIPSVTGATYLEFTTPSALIFPGTYDQQFDFNLVMADVSGIPEPSSGLLFASVILPMMLRRKREL